MGPFNEIKQLERKATVFALLQRNDLSEWARNYWGNVYDRIAMSEEHYNARVVGFFNDVRSRQTKEWW
jgi:hypothetical protein